MQAETWTLNRSYPGGGKRRVFSSKGTAHAKSLRWQELEESPSDGSTEQGGAGRADVRERQGLGAELGAPGSSGPAT